MFGSESKKGRTDAPGGFLKRLRARLNRGDSWLTVDIADLVRGRAIDAAILDELESRLLAADVGVEATQYILDSLRQRVARRELGDVDALIGALRATLLLLARRPTSLTSSTGSSTRAYASTCRGPAPFTGCDRATPTASC